MALPQFTTLSLEVRPEGYAVLELSRPAKSNAVSTEMWDELPQVVLCGKGKHFCAGIDFAALEGVARVVDAKCPVTQKFQRLQTSHATRSHCMLLSTARGYCSADAFFCVKEVDLAITADMGTLQRLPRIVGAGAAAELALTARRLGAAEAHALRLVSGVHPDAAALRAAAGAAAAAIAARSPLAVAGTKRVLLHSRDRSVADGLEFVAALNSAQLPSADLQAVFRAVARREQPRFAKL